MKENELKYKIGDVVVHKSGSGPEMAIGKFDRSPMASEGYTGYVVCNWFDVNNQPQSAKFHQDELELDED